MSGRNEYRMVVAPGGVKLARNRASGERVPTSSAGALDEEAVRVSKERQGCATGRAGRESRGFTAKSRANLRWRFASYPFGDVKGRLAMVTLTYPAVFPLEGLVVRAHRKEFYDSWRQRFGSPEGMWIQEFQERGAAHTHMYVGLPDGAELIRNDGVKDWRGWVWPWASERWDAIVDSGDPWHRQCGVNVRPCFYSKVEQANLEVIAAYFAKESAKVGQKKPPPGYTHVGRYWGSWGLKPVEHEHLIDRDSFVAIRRPLRLLRDKRSRRKVRSRRSMDGLNVTGVDGLDMGVRLLRWARG